MFSLYKSATGNDRDTTQHHRARNYTLSHNFTTTAPGTSHTPTPHPHHTHTSLSRSKLLKVLQRQFIQTTVIIFLGLGNVSLPFTVSQKLYGDFVERHAKVINRLHKVLRVALFLNLCGAPLCWFWGPIQSDHSCTAVFHLYRVLQDSSNLPENLKFVRAA